MYNYHILLKQEHHMTRGLLMDTLFNNLTSANNLLNQYTWFDETIQPNNYQTKIQVKSRIKELESLIEGIKEQITYWQQKNFEKGE